VLEDLKPRFDAEGLMFIHENRMGDALGVSRAIDEGLHARYLFVAQSVVPGRRGKRRRE
jgi:hypothetical protein